MKLVDDNEHIMKEGDCDPGSMSYQIVLSVACIVFVIINIGRETFQFFKMRMSYFYDPFNWLDIFLITFTAAIVYEEIVLYQLG